MTNPLQIRIQSKSPIFLETRYLLFARVFSEPPFLTPRRPWGRGCRIVSHAASRLYLVRHATLPVIGGEKRCAATKMTPAYERNKRRYSCNKIYHYIKMAQNLAKIQVLKLKQTRPPTFTIAKIRGYSQSQWGGRPPEFHSAQSRAQFCQAYPVPAFTITPVTQTQ